jgi:uncharacterized membrane protein
MDARAGELSEVDCGPGGANSRAHRRSQRSAIVAALTAVVLAAAFIPVVSAASGLDITTDYPAVVVAPGDKVGFDLTVTSTGSGRVELKLDGVPSGWTASLQGGGHVVDAVLAKSGAGTAVRLDVSVPSDASGTHRITLTGSGAGGTATLPLDIRVTPSAAGDVKLDTDTPSLQGSTTDTFRFNLTLRNNTPQDLTVSVTTQGPANWDVTASLTAQSQAASTRVAAGSSTGIEITAKPPSDATAGSYPIQVEAKAGDRTINGQLQVDVTGSYAMTLTTPDQRLNTHGSAGSAIRQQVVVRNGGTAPLENVALTATPPTGWDVKFEPATIATVAPGDQQTATAVITPNGDAIAGDYSVSIRAANDKANQSIDLRVTVETSLLWGFVGVALILVVLAGLAFVFRRYGRR